MKKAIAIKYCKDIDVPIIMAKGEGRTAEKIIMEAISSEVFLKEDKVMVDVLEDVKTGSMVPENAWEALAKIFSFIISEH